MFVLTKVDAPVHVLAESNDEAALFDGRVGEGAYSQMFTVRIYGSTVPTPAIMRHGVVPSPTKTGDDANLPAHRCSIPDSQRRTKQYTSPVGRISETQKAFLHQVLAQAVR